MKSWKTTVLGVCAIIGAIVPFVIALLDNNPETVPDIETMLTALASGFAGLGLVAAKDATASE